MAPHNGMKMSVRNRHFRIVIPSGALDLFRSREKDGMSVSKNGKPAIPRTFGHRLILYPAHSAAPFPQNLLLLFTITPPAFHSKPNQQENHI